ncbi:MAG TPA: hypothetical protein VMJ10_16350 [Kofleriaceae bacterium]|nr:hypothetical protein [Kofleriaceae bacterium]
MDWARGLVTADATSLADRHAPSPAVARGTGRRPAEDAAKAKLRAAVLALPVANGGRLGEPAADKALAAAYVIAADPETDGAWHVTMAVPIEAVRQAIAGPRVLPDAGDSGPAVVIVDGATGAPAVGALAAATIWTDAIPAFAKDAPHVAWSTGMTVDPGALYIVYRK